MVALTDEEEQPGITIPDGSAQQEFFWDGRRYLVWIGGRGSSKTASATLRLIGMISRGEIAPGDRVLVFGPSYPQMRKGTLVTFDEWFDRTGWVLEKINGNEPERRLMGDITVYFRNASNPDQTRGHEVRLVWLDEAAQMDEAVFTLATAALRQRRRDGTHPPYQLICTTTPRGRNWLYRRFKDPASRFDASQMGYYETTTLDAIKYGFLPANYIEEMGYVEGSEMWKQEIEGQFITWGGLVFHAFHPTRHCPEPFTVPEFKAVYGGIDIGLTAPTSMHLTGVTPSGKMFTFKEFYKRRCLPHEWMKTAAEWTKEHNVRRWYVDAAADQELRAMKSAGLPAYPSMKSRDAAGTAVNFINSKLQRDELFIDRTACPFLVSEVETYQHKELNTGDETTFLDTIKPNQPDHAIDDWRYHILPLSSASAAQSYGQSIPFSIGG